MANSAQARKRARQASAQRDSNMSQRSEFAHRDQESA